MIKCKEGGEGIGGGVGVGGLCGLGWVKVCGNKVWVEGKGENGKVLKNDVGDRISGRYMVKNCEDGEWGEIKLGCICRDGYILMCDDEEIVVDNMEGGEGGNWDMLLLGVDEEVWEGIEKGISLVGYWCWCYERLYSVYKEWENG